MGLSIQQEVAVVALVVAAATAVWACGGDGAAVAINRTVAPPSTAGTEPPPSTVATVTVADGGDTADADRDGDGLSDALEATLAHDALPFLSIHPNDGCRTHGIAVRITPHPRSPGLVMIRGVVLYNQDCGATRHPGDDEGFGVLVDPSLPAAAGILAVRAISHQDTACEHTTTCGSCGGLSPCTTATKNGMAYPVLYPSKDKHGNYVDSAVCASSIVCDLGGCAQATTDAAVAVVNVGEPTHPLVDDLTAQGFITAANGWTETSLFHFDPWKPGDFGEAGDLSADLVDDRFVIDCAP